MTDLQPTPGTPQVLWGRRGDVGCIRLNRPEAINALNTEMCRAVLDLVGRFNDDGVARIEISGEGPKGLCAGGDVRAVRQAVLDGDPERAEGFFVAEYAMDQAIAASRTPVTAHQRGITMGGGLGISAHAADRIVHPDARIAMPETIIGFHPDVGMLKLLADAPGELGAHLALTGVSINATDALLAGFSDRLPDGEQAPEATLTDADWMRECYVGRDASAVVARLESHDHPDARAAAELVRQRSPLSVWVALEGLRRAATMSLAEVFDQDLALARSAAHNPDFLEGVRAQLVDKDRTPTWQHARIEDVDPADVAAMF